MDDLQLTYVTAHSHQKRLNYREIWDWPFLKNLAGLVKITDPLDSGLSSDGNATAGVERFALSVFHQLHCLQALQTSILHLATEGPPSSSHTAHAYHCFDYLRHNIMCAGDMTLENPNRQRIEGLKAPIWAGTTHVCKHWGDITSWQAEHFSPMV